MQPTPEWKVAQVGEKGLWDGVVHLDYYILRVLADNAAKIPSLRAVLSPVPATCLEVGIGPFGLGLTAFLPEISLRFAVDPLPPVPLISSPDVQLKSTEEIRIYMRQIRKPIHYVRGVGEELPFKSDTFDFVVCSNVLDHVSDPNAIIREMHRVMRPSGRLYIDVDTFSLLGLAKWHLYTKHARNDEILVTTHPHRMLESEVVRRLRSLGFRLQKIGGHSFRSNLVGHARDSTFLGTK
jgi:SAM-dependent methyltransferase